MSENKEHRGKPVVIILWVAIVLIIVGMSFMFNVKKAQPNPALKPSGASTQPAK